MNRADQEIMIKNNLLDKSIDLVDAKGGAIEKAINQTDYLMTSMQKKSQDYISS
jgi:hypothetical protein